MSFVFEYIHVHVSDIRYTLTNQEGILHHNLNPRKIVETECHIDESPSHKLYIHELVHAFGSMILVILDCT